jgi:hypothetical protein
MDSVSSAAMDMVGAIGFLSGQVGQPSSFKEEEIRAITRSLDCEDRAAEDLSD